MAETQRRYYRSLDFFRGVAAFYVALLHFRLGPLYAPSAYLFVDFFFILSGFVICHAYFRNYEKYDFETFLSHRLARLYPLHLFTMLLMFVLFLALGQGLRPDDTPANWALNLLLLQNVGLNAHVSWNAPSWSISTELWINLLFFALPLLWRRGTTALFLALALAVLGTPGSNRHSENVFQFLNIGLVRCALGFLLGVLAYRGHAFFADRGHKVGRLAWTLCELLPLPFMAYLIYDANQSGAVSLVFLPVAMATVFIYAQEGGLVSLGVRTLRLHWLGLISYSVYLNHMPLRMILENSPLKDAAKSEIFVVGALLAMSTVTYLLLERPLARRLRNAFTRGNLRLGWILAALAFAFVTTAAVAWYGGRLPSAVTRTDAAELARFEPKGEQQGLRYEESLRFHRGLSINVPAGVYETLDLALTNDAYEVSFLLKGEEAARLEVAPRTGVETLVLSLEAPETPVDEVLVTPVEVGRHALGYFALR